MILYFPKVQLTSLCICEIENGEIFKRKFYFNAYDIKIHHCYGNCLLNIKFINQLMIHRSLHNHNVFVCPWSCNHWSCNMLLNCLNFPDCLNFSLIDLSLWLSLTNTKHNLICLLLLIIYSSVNIIISCNSWCSNNQ